MNKPELTQSVSPISALLRQAIAFVSDFAAFAGLSGVIAAALAVLAAMFEGVRPPASGAAVVDRYRVR
jgi:hypothetical protein